MSSTMSSSSSSNGNNGHHQYDQKWIVAMAEEGSPFIKVKNDDDNNNNNNNNNLVCLIKTFPDPSTRGEQRQYAVTGGNYHIMEFQALESEFSSFLVGRHVVQDGTLYTVNRVDPLFFVVATQQAPNASIVAESTQRQQQQQRRQQRQQQQNHQSSKQWQPMNQFLSSMNIPHEVQKALLVSCRKGNNNKNQLLHLCDSISESDRDSNTDDDGMMFLKFNPTKTLKWLQKKQERVLMCLKDQYTEHQQRQQRLLDGKNKKMKYSCALPSLNSSGSTLLCQPTAKGSSSDTFNIPIQPELETVTKTTDSSSSEESTKGDSQEKLETLELPSSSSLPVVEGIISESRIQQLKSDSIDIVCEYLNDEWTIAFKDHLGWKEPSSTSSAMQQPSWIMSTSTSTSIATPSYDKNKTVHRTVTPIDPFSTHGGQSSSSSSSSSSSAKKKMASSQTAGNKRLAKVKTKGMKSISSFFGAAASQPNSKKAKT